MIAARCVWWGLTLLESFTVFSLSGFCRAACAMSRARIWIATAWCSWCRVSQASVSSIRDRRGFGFFSQGCSPSLRGVLVLAGCRSEADEESVYHGAGVKQVFERAEGRRRECREGLCRRGQIGPIGRNQRLTAVRQDEHEQPSTFAVQRPQKVERLAFERMGAHGRW